MKSWYFIIFAPGLGGNHLANIISLDDKFKTRVTPEEYKSAIENVHPRGDKVIDLDYSSDKIFCCHLAEYLWFSHEVDVATVHKKYIVVEFPPNARSPLAIDRLHHLYDAYRDPYFLEELSTLYSVNAVRRLTGCDDVTGITIDLIFDQSSRKLLDFLHKNFGFNIDHDLASSMQSDWINLVEKR